ncbi:MAG: NfeD family protein [Lachnospiraceae bacterium]|uniref:NfeD family protein n=1 Tax=Parablautia sp. Marseille-Q6255 TaxID=3039593 RepID=UPI0024BD4486|nr:NfeD family protein [Parablautia sp. Marseille-Q6255]
MEINMQAVVWLVVLVALLAAEAITLGLTTIWFAGGALIAFGLAIAGTEVLLQIIVFCVVSVLLLVVTRPAALRWFNRERTRTNAGSLIGETAVVTEAVDNLEGTGQVQVKGQFWTARSVSDQGRIAAGNKVKIKKISGVKLIVEEV